MSPLNHYMCYFLLNLKKNILKYSRLNSCGCNPLIRGHQCDITITITIAITNNNNNNRPQHSVGNYWKLHFSTPCTYVGQAGWWLCFLLIWGFYDYSLYYCHYSHYYKMWDLDAFCLAQEVQKSSRKFTFHYIFPHLHSCSSLVLV